MRILKIMMVPSSLGSCNLSLAIFIIFLISSYSNCKAGKGFGSSSSSIPKFKFTGKIKPGDISPTLLVPGTIARPDYALDGIPKNTGVKARGNPWDVIPLDASDIPRMRTAGRLAREVLDAAVRIVRPGLTTREIDELVHKETIERNSYPSPLNYHGFPKSCCTSVNEIICHGIPDSTVLQEGDIVNIDVTIFHEGVHGDCSETVFVGNVSPEVRELVVTTHAAWQAAIDICRPGVNYRDIGGVIEDIVKAKGFTTVKEFCGHGIGRVFHTTPNVLHYKNMDRCGVMAPGHCFTIEPMICLGSNKPVMWPDKWTAATSDGKPTAQFEHTLLITETGVEALTAKLPTSPKYSWE